MQLIGITPVGTETIHVHKSTCRDISSEIYHGNTYDDCQHIAAESKSDAVALLPANEIQWFPCTRTLKKI